MYNIEHKKKELNMNRINKQSLYLSEDNLEDLNCNMKKLADILVCKYLERKM